ncbi:GNAT family N-acetyltransferase [Luteipulveratus sp. YIM 133132]|uniref:GNAT family N-acetyltransferase n=1 Tax=Luteipulveratus flavus TaxID=3031728 RepID=UPI0023B12728|nr:GNAT family N-acetyltransferase [Luteipulveratus sp. YIM 133132]MDE9364181.1 GNAT family N-acetyltransferase [Luteipulveratus sp. YIM 133132]
MTRRPLPLIRTADDSDACRIADIHVRSRAATMPYLPAQTRTRDEVIAWVTQVVLPAGPVWVAEQDHQVCGYAAVKGDLLDALYVLPEMLGRGIGAALLDQVQRAATGPVRLFVFEQNVGARRFYERHGFVVTQRGDGTGNMEGLPDLTMRWVRERV